MLFIIVSLTYIFFWEAHTHAHAQKRVWRPIYYPSYVLDLFQAAPIQTLAVSRLWGFSSNAALMNTTYLAVVSVDYILRVMDVKIRLEP